MKARTFAGLMFPLLVFTIILLVIAAPGKPEIQNPAAIPGSRNTQVQAAEGFMIWESVSTHLLGILQ